MRELHVPEELQDDERYYGNEQEYPDNSDIQSVQAGDLYHVVTTVHFTQENPPQKGKSLLKARKDK